MTPAEQRTYDAWFAQARSLLEAHQWAEALKGVPRLEGLEPAAPRPLRTPLGTATIALVTSAGVSGPAQPPMDGENVEGDYTIRVLDVDTPADQIAVSHTHFDTSIARQDLNTVYPVERLRELAVEGVIGRLAPCAVSFMGYFPNVFRIRDEVAPAVVAAVQQTGADAALLVPV